MVSLALCTMALSISRFTFIYFDMATGPMSARSRKIRYYKCLIWKLKWNEHVIRICPHNSLNLYTRSMLSPDQFCLILVLLFWRFCSLHNSLISISSSDVASLRCIDCRKLLFYGSFIGLCTNITAQLLHSISCSDCDCDFGCGTHTHTTIDNEILLFEILFVGNFHQVLRSIFELCGKEKSEIACIASTQLKKMLAKWCCLLHS